MAQLLSPCEQIDPTDIQKLNEQPSKSPEMFNYLTYSFITVI